MRQSLVVTDGSGASYAKKPDEIAAVTLESFSYSCMRKFQYINLQSTSSYGGSSLYPV